VGWPDIVILIVLALGALAGFRRGLIGELSGALALAAGVLAAFVYTGGLDAPVAHFTHLGPGSSHVVGMVLFGLIAYGIVIAIGSFLSGIAKLPIINLLNGVGGAGVGFLKSLLFVWVAIYIALFFPLSHDLRADLRKSALVSLITSSNGNLDGRIRNDIPSYVRPLSAQLFDRHKV
jgi:uncharacterized membrane protein required for colicin V production